jgi:hypothetical protein
MSDSEESSEYELEWDPVETSKQAADILHQTIFDFANVVYKLCQQDEHVHPDKYHGMQVLPSVKILVVTGLMKCWDNNRERLAEHYVNCVLNWKKKIAKRKVSFFLENDDIYVGPGNRRPSKEDIEFFRDLWRPSSTFRLNDREKEKTFVYFDTMCHYCEEWKRLTKYVAVWEK